MKHLVSTPVYIVNALFSLGIVLAIVAQVVAYRSGQRTRQRCVAMWLGIFAACLLFAAGQIASVKLRDYANSVSARMSGDGL